jgi:hypothetical protein
LNNFLNRHQDGDTALHFAVQSGHAAVARILITNHNARTTIKNNAGLNHLKLQYRALALMHALSGRLASDVAAGAARGMIQE